MEGDEDDDTHICLKCRTTIHGLDNYVKHRKAGCVRSVVESKSHRDPSATVTQNDKSDTPSTEPGLRADDFFSSLELQSSSKKPVSSPGSARGSGMVTRRKASVLAGGANKPDSGSELQECSDSAPQLIEESIVVKPVDEEEEFVCEDESEYEYEDEDGDEMYPPRSHTGGKWKPGSGFMNRAPSPSWARSSTTAATTPSSVHQGESWSLLLDDGSCRDAPPPPSFTGGKWKPTGMSSHDLPIPVVDQDSRVASADEDEDHHETMRPGMHPPPPGHTSGKWVPAGGGGSLRKSGSTVQYWCGPCNRSLSSRTLYDRHILSELHFKRTLQERELEDREQDQQQDVKRRNIRRTEAYINSELWSRSKRNRLRRLQGKFSEGEDDDGSELRQKKLMHSKPVRCEVCRTRVWHHLLGKHLVSHYHRRKARLSDTDTTRLVLENIHSIVRQAPFQCGPCKFYCNTRENFQRHWESTEHASVDMQVPGSYWCSLCKHECNTLLEMQKHIDGTMHQELVSVINGSVPVVIRKRTSICCNECGARFIYNLQLRRHCLQTGHRLEEKSTASDEYQSRFPCSECSGMFVATSRFALQRHVMLTHRDGGAYYCSSCSLRFGSAEEAVAHRQSQQHRYSVMTTKRPEDVTRTCQHCGGVFLNVLSLKQHLRQQHADYLSKCPNCGKAFALPQELSRHVRERACVFEESKTAGSHRCGQCPYSTDSRAEFLFHEALHGEPVPDSENHNDDDEEETSPETRAAPRYRCPLCPRALKKYSLRRHLRMHTFEPTCECNVCLRTFVHRSSLVKHMRQMHSEDVEKFKCTSCPFSTLRKDSMERHNLTHSDQRSKTYLCAVCGASFYIKGTLQQHMKVHTGKDYRCDHEGCVFASRSRAELRYHQQVHSEERPYHCDSCTFSAKTKGQLLRHKTVHKSEKAYKCPHCAFSARMATHLRRHLRLHTGAKPYHCPYCSYTCNILENLRKHVLSTNKHPGKSLYECQYCSNFRTNLAKDLRVHLVKNHPDHFGSASRAASYVAGIYNADNDPKHVDDPIEVAPRWRRIKRPDPSERRTIRKEAQELPALPVAQEVVAVEANVDNREHPDMMSMVVVESAENIYIKLPSAMEGEGGMDSALFSGDGDGFLSHLTGERRPSAGERSSSSTMLLEEEDEQMVGNKEGTASTSETIVITVPSSCSGGESLATSHHHSQEEGYRKVVTQRVQEHISQQSYVVIFK